MRNATQKKFEISDYLTAAAGGVAAAAVVALLRFGYNKAVEAIKTKKDS